MKGGRREKVEREEGMKEERKQKNRDTDCYLLMSLPARLCARCF
jgi:hypothetical protein